MYKIFADDTLIYDSNLQEYTITKGQITQEVISPGHLFSESMIPLILRPRIQKLKTIITVA